MGLISHLGVGVVDFLFFERVALLVWKQDTSLLYDTHLLLLVVGKELLPIVLRGTGVEMCLLLFHKLDRVFTQQVGL